MPTRTSVRWRPLNVGTWRLADRQAELFERITGTPTKGVAGLLVKARAVRLRPFQVGYDRVATLGWSLAGDVLAPSVTLPESVASPPDRRATLPRSSEVAPEADLVRI